ncbi:uncharacterized protein LOC119283264 isoform X4 [Triticum dicoccoides]|uniref:uncharacterized protein LOC119283264 isoform X4 n=1 Tax=Triticum dicoccoides TaxID=85692 RepID=UPI00188E0D24|nr:uncharacterized protein LOC119283264 isoform X4 [Triticum dicoccoides]
MGRRVDLEQGWMPWSVRSGIVGREDGDFYSLIFCYLEASRGKASYFMVQRTRVMYFIVMQLLLVYISLIGGKDAYGQLTSSIVMLNQRMLRSSAFKETDQLEDYQLNMCLYDLHRKMTRTINYEKGFILTSQWEAPMINLVIAGLQLS